MQISINGEHHSVPPEWQNASLLSLLRDHLQLTGTKFGCGKGLCGACTVHLDGRAARACSLPLSAVGDADVTTIEGLAGVDRLHPVQRAWIELAVPQCGYCQPGQIMTAAALLAREPDPSAEQVSRAMDGNLCRCGTYTRIRAAVLHAASLARSGA